MNARDALLRCLGRIKRALAGRKLNRSLERNKRAAKELDRVVREVLET